jgi:hypothetical protein
MRKKILQLLLPGTVAVMTVMGCASDSNTSPPTAVREPATMDYPCGEVLVREPTIEPCRELVDAGDPDREHYWVSGYWAKTPPGWVWIPGHEEPSPGVRPPAVRPATNSIPLTAQAVQY